MEQLVFLLLYSEILRERNKYFLFDIQLYSDCWEKKIILAPAPLLLSIRFTSVSTGAFTGLETADTGTNQQNVGEKTLENLENAGIF